MAQEIELKLALKPHQVPLVRRHPQLQGVPHLKRCIRNVYLDTPDHTLKEQHIALRRRQIGSEWWLTVKTAAPTDPLTGLSRRQEWEYPMPPDQLDFSPIDTSRLRALLVAAMPCLSMTFRTDFVRTAWVVEIEQSQIELALDLGRISSANNRASICELELELLSGNESALLSLAQSFEHSLGLTPLTQSKAARGYHLLEKI